VGGTGRVAVVVVVIELVGARRRLMDGGWLDEKDILLYSFIH